MNLRSRIRVRWASVASRSVRTRTDVVVVLLDAIFVVAAFVAMMVLRFDGSFPDELGPVLRWFLPLAILISVASNWRWGLYGQLWRYASIHEARRLVQSGFTILVVVVAVGRLEPTLPISVLVTAPVVATFLMALVRFQSRLVSSRRAGESPGLRVVVIGCGDAGAHLVADMLRSPRAGFRPIAVLDDDPTYRGRSFAGVAVRGGIDDLPDVVRATGANLAVFAMTNAPQEVVRRAAAAAEEADVALKIVPGIALSINGGVTLRDIRDLRIEDLLGREQVDTDLEAVSAMLAGKRVLITGAGGSIGSEIARQVSRLDPAQLILLDHDETHLHDVANELDGPVVQVLADIRNRRRVMSVFDDHWPEVVFHAAAHKHVPLLEAHPSEAVLTNVVGSANVIDAAIEHGVARLVSISTDKAVYPSSVMGATKRLSEQLVLRRSPGDGAYCAVRFGNVLGSRGSVVPTFMRQIEAGGPVTVTDERMSRFFMSIEEAVQLVLQAGVFAENSGGEVFMLDMGEPVQILKLAERMIRLSGRQPGRDIEIRITGTRPGEKLAEELTSLDERETSTPHPSIRRVTTTLVPAGLLEQGIEELSNLALDLRDDACVQVLRRLVFPDELTRSDFLRPVGAWARGGRNGTPRLHRVHGEVAPANVVARESM